MNLLNALECEPAVGDASGDGDEVCDIVMVCSELPHQPKGKTSFTCFNWDGLMLVNNLLLVGDTVDRGS